MCSAGYLLSTPVEEVKGRKPHTKLQQRCLDLCNTLPPITDAQLRWGKNRHQPLGYFVQKGRGGRDSFVWCQECGHMEKVGFSALYVSVAKPEYTCEKCGSRLLVKQGSLENKSVGINYPFALITTCKEFQVARVFNLHKWNCMGYDTVEHVREVFSVWVDLNKGKEVIVTRPYYRTYNSFYWRNYGPWKIGRHNGSSAGSYYLDDLYDLRGYDVYPRMRVQPLLKRNGWSSEMRKMKASPVELWRVLMTDPAIEGLAKNGQYSVIDYWLSIGNENKDKSRWLPQVRICNRRKYIIKDASLWFDNLKALRKLGMDDHSPKYLCPDDLHAMHDWLQRKVEKYDIREELKKLNSKARDWEQYYAESKGKFFSVSFNDGNIFCHVIRSVAEMCEEGTRMHHCVYRMGYYKRPESLILSARDRGGNRLETVEVNLDTFSVVQSRGLQNHPTLAHADIIRLVEQNMNIIKRAKAV